MNRTVAQKPRSEPWILSNFTALVLTECTEVINVLPTVISCAAYLLS